MPEPLLDRRRVKILAQGVAKQARRRLVRHVQLPFPYTAPPVPRGVELLPEDTSLEGNYDTEWARGPGARVARGLIVDAVLRPSIALVAKPDRQGLDRLRRLNEDQNALFVANHHSHLDTSLLLTSIPKPWRSRLAVAAAADYFFDTRIKATLSALAIGAIPIDRHKPGRASANQAAALLDEGNSVLIFPEGGRSPDGWGQPFKGGAAYLAIRCAVPVVPVYLAGTGRVWRKGQRLPKPSPTTVIFGAPMYATEGESTRSFNARIQAAVASLGDESASDWWQARKRFHEGDSPTMTGPTAASWRRSWALGDRGAAQRRKPTWPN